MYIYIPDVQVVHLGENHVLKTTGSGLNSGLLS